MTNDFQMQTQFDRLPAEITKNRELFLFTREIYLWEIPTRDRLVKFSNEIGSMKLLRFQNHTVDSTVLIPVAQLDAC